MLNKKLVLALVILFSIMSIGLYLLVITNQKSEREYHDITKNIQSPWVNNNDIYFFTGTEFAKYNTVNNKISSLSKPIFIEGSIEFISWSKDMVVFQSNPQSDNLDDLTTGLVSLNKEPYISHWWIYDFKNSQYQYLSFADECDSVVALNESLIACEDDGELGSTSSNITFYKKNGLTLQKGFTIKSDNKIDKISYSKNKIFYTESTIGGKNYLKVINKDKSSKTIFEAKEDTKIESYKVSNNIIAIKTINNVSIDPKDDSHSSSQSKSIDQFITVLNNESVVDSEKFNLPNLNIFIDNENIKISSLDGSVYEIDRDNKINQSHKPIKNMLSNGDLSFTINNKIYKIDNRNNLQGNSNTARPKSNYIKPSLYNIASYSDKTGKSMILEEKNGVFPVYLLNNETNIQLQQEAVMRLLTSYGFKPSEFVFRWTVGSSINTNLIQPNVVEISLITKD